MKVFLGISSFQMLAVFRRGLFFSYLTIYLRHFLGLSVTSTTLFATLPRIVNVLAQRYIWGVLSDKLQKRRAFIIWGEILGGIGTIALFYAHRIPADKIAAGWVVIAGMAVIEIFWSMSNIGWSALISDIYKQGNRSTIMGRLESMGGMGRIVGVLVGGLLYDKMGTSFEGWGFYEGSLFWISGVVMFLSIFPMVFVPEGGVDQNETQPCHTSDTMQFNPTIFYIFIAAITLIHFGRNAIAVTLPQYLTLDSGLNLSSLTLSHVVNIRSVGLILTGFLAGVLSRKLGNRGLLTLSSFIAAISLFIIGTTTQMMWICISSFLMGFSEVLIIAASYEMASSYIPAEKRGTYFAMFNATFFLSWGVGSTLIAGPLTDCLISAGHSEAFAYMASFNACGMMTLTGVLVLFLLYYMEGRQKRNQA